jgi:hypothetical protein
VADGVDCRRFPFHSSNNNIYINISPYDYKVKHTTRLSDLVDWML